MYEIEFYEESDGYSEITEFIKELRRKGVANKESRIMVIRCKLCLYKVKD